MNVRGLSCSAPGYRRPALRFLFSGGLCAVMAAAKQRRVRRRWRALFAEMTSISPDAVEGAWDGLLEGLIASRRDRLIMIGITAVASILLLVEALEAAA